MQINSIKEILAQENISIEKLIECVELVRANGDVIAIKLDGERASNQYTTFISFPSDKNREIVRRDGGSLQSTLTLLLNDYVKVCEARQKPLQVVK